MFGILILISSICMMILLFKLMKPAIVSYILAFLLSVLYGFLLFYSIFTNRYIFNGMLALPFIILAFILIKDHLRK